jgi:hypothetical protein
MLGLSARTGLYKIAGQKPTVDAPGVRDIDVRKARVLFFVAMILT